MVVSGHRLRLLRKSKIIYHHKGNKTIILEYTQKLSNGNIRTYYYTGMLTGKKICYLEKVDKQNEYVIKALANKND